MTGKPHLSYVLAATDAAELAKALTWLRAHPLSPQVEVVLAAPASELARTAGRIIPSWVRLAGAIRPADRNAIRVAGAQVTSGGIVMVVDCDEDLGAKVQDPFDRDAQVPVSVAPAADWSAATHDDASAIALPPGLGTRAEVVESAS
jgi:hypothetical protein